MKTMRVDTFFVDQFGVQIGHQSSVRFPTDWESVSEFQSFKVFRALEESASGAEARTEVIRNGVRISEFEPVEGIKQIQEIVLENAA